MLRLLLDWIRIAEMEIGLVHRVGAVFLPHIETALIAQHNCPLGSKLLRRLRINTPRINILRLSPTKVSRTMVNGNVHNVAARFLRRRQCRVIFHEAASETHPDGLACGGEAGMPPDQRCLLVRPCLYVLDAKQVDRGMVGKGPKGNRGDVDSSIFTFSGLRFLYFGVIRSQCREAG